MGKGRQNPCFCFLTRNRMKILLIRFLLVLVVAIVVGGTTYVVLSIIEILQKK